MKKFNTYIKLYFIATIAVIIASCSSTEVISSWNLNPVPTGVMKKILVLGVMTNWEERDQIEEIMVSEFRKAGVDANTATGVFGPKGFQGLTEEQITEKLEGSEYSAVMIVSLQDKERERRYNPGMHYTTPRIVGYSRYYRRYLVVYDNMYTPGYYTTSTNYILEADIYTINGKDELIYSAQTRSYDPSSAKYLGESFSKAMIKEMKEKGIIN